MVGINVASVDIVDATTFASAIVVQLQPVFRLPESGQSEYDRFTQLAILCRLVCRTGENALPGGRFSRQASVFGLSGEFTDWSWASQHKMKYPGRA